MGAKRVSRGEAGTRGEWGGISVGLGFVGVVKMGEGAEREFDHLSRKGAKAQSINGRK